MKIVDSHTHFELLHKDESDNDTGGVIARAKEQGIAYFLNVCVKMSRFQHVLEPALQYPFVFASVGLHPNEDEEETDLETLIQLGQNERVVAVGETGLDYYRSSGELDWQRDRFRQHIAAAHSLKKPLIIHMRNATDDTINILQTEKARDVGGVMHCFTEDWATAQRALDLGFYISFSGIVTFKNALHIQDAARKMPIDRMLIETDAPYLAPVPMRGKKNEPAYLQHTAQYLADLRGMEIEAFAEQTTQNFFNLFKGAKPTHV
jgi:TatD DNase family protein